MIRVTRLDQSEFYINSDLIETVESTPDTHIRLTNGQMYLVRESAEEIVERVIEFQRAIHQSRPLKAIPS